MTSDIDDLPPLRDVISANDLWAKKGLGQNFLLDLNLTRKIARAAAPLGEMTVYEVGPGPGGLTRALLVEGATKIVATERDERCRPALEQIQQASGGAFQFQIADALGLQEPSLFGDKEPVQIVANLPYNVGTALLLKWLAVDTWPPWFKRATLLFQREVGERIVAKPGTSSYGRLSVLVAWRSDAQLLFDIPPSAFIPAPKVTSSLIQITPFRQPKFEADFAVLQKVTAAAFGQRRKMLRSALKALGPDPRPLLADCGIDPTARAEEISIEGFCALATAYQNHHAE